MNRFLVKLRALFRKEKLDRDMAEEMRFHLKQRVADNIDDGLAPDDARYAAQRQFGGVDQIRREFILCAGGGHGANGEPGEGLMPGAGGIGGAVSPACFITAMAGSTS